MALLALVQGCMVAYVARIRYKPLRLATARISENFRIAPVQHLWRRWLSAASLGSYHDFVWLPHNTERICFSARWLLGRSDRGRASFSEGCPPTRHPPACRASGGALCFAGGSVISSERWPSAGCAP
jgi:hypothetical protein